MNDLADHMRVTLRFAVVGRIFEVTRTLRRASDRTVGSAKGVADRVQYRTAVRFARSSKSARSAAASKRSSASTPKPSSVPWSCHKASSPGYSSATTQRREPRSFVRYGAPTSSLKRDNRR